MPGKATTASYAEMLDLAVNSGKGEKVSRQKIYTYIRINYKIDTDGATFKRHIKAAFTKRLDAGIILQQKNSFYLSAKGKKHIADQYDLSDNDNEASETEENTPSKPSKSVKSK
ncbi:uncharacterized protein RHOBADRAFT_46161 [Rhodotorula graminis WP1]|uniref:Histone H1 n=1 Tax=Rhodotorula graminis (strain WP1) TaxID=578459 RepID=A0A0P9EMN9_RHOGW|nr:uncharacterized protein RHOBADRAFT_46161 [Rhodotorula graminis WP1]KPV73067.1 hypothetical protein RHOBADRAFT_46161 [Rhodotorula graminis WP1]